MIVRALSIRQPWAKLILSGAKDIENRCWNTKHRGLVLLHAAKGMTYSEYEDAFVFANSGGRKGNPGPSVSLERGGIVGAALLTTIYAPGEDGGLWHSDQAFGFKLESVTPLPFRPLKGALGFFKVEVTPAEADALRAAKLAA